MRYFINRDLPQVIAVEDGANQCYLFDTELTLITHERPNATDSLPVKTAGGGPSKKKPKPKYPDDLSDLTTPKKRIQITPALIFKIKEKLTAGEKVADIVEDTGLSAPTIYKFKADLNL